MVTVTSVFFPMYICLPTFLRFCHQGPFPRLDDVPNMSHLRVVRTCLLLSQGDRSTAVHGGRRCCPQITVQAGDMCPCSGDGGRLAARATKEPGRASDAVPPTLRSFPPTETGRRELAAPRQPHPACLPRPLTRPPSAAGQTSILPSCLLLRSPPGSVPPLASSGTAPHGRPLQLAPTEGPSGVRVDSGTPGPSVCRGPDCFPREHSGRKLFSRPLIITLTSTELQIHCLFFGGFLDQRKSV